MLKELLSRRVLLVLGKGGVGKTTISAAIAKLCAASGSRALLMETDTRAPLATMFAIEPSFDPKEAAPNLSLMTLDGRHALEEYLRLVVPSRMLLKAVFASRLYQFFVQAAPGLRELMMLGKIYYEAERKDLKPPNRRVIIVDAPASGQAMSLLKMPTAARTTFADSVVGKEASNISKMLRDRRHCAVVQVTNSDALSVAETIETNAELARIHLAPAAVIFNRMVAANFSPSDIAALKNRRVPRNRKKNLDHIAEIAESELRRVAEARKAFTSIRTATAAPLIEIAEHRSLAGIDLIDYVAADLARDSEIDLPEIHTQ